MSSHLIPKRKYTLELFEYFYGLGWSEEGSCYQIAGKSIHGGSFPAGGAVFEKLTSPTRRRHRDFQRRTRNE